MKAVLKKAGYFAILFLSVFSRRNREIPVLTYHSIDDSGSHLSTSLATFNAQMQYLEEEGYRSIDVKELFGYLKEGYVLPKKAFMITFDEAYANFRSALPALEKHGFTALLFVVADKAGCNTEWTALPDLTTLNWKEIAELPGTAVEIGSHSLTHRLLTDMRDAELEREICGSKEMIEEKLKTGADGFAYPFGKFDQRCKESAGKIYKLAFGTEFGLVTKKSDLSALERIDINILNDESAFRSFFSNSRGFQILKKLFGTP